LARSKRQIRYSAVAQNGMIWGVGLGGGGVWGASSHSSPSSGHPSPTQSGPARPPDSPGGISVGSADGGWAKALSAPTRHSRPASSHVHRAVMDNSSSTNRR